MSKIVAGEEKNEIWELLENGDFSIKQRVLART